MGSQMETIFMRIPKFFAAASLLTICSFWCPIGITRPSDTSKSISQVSIDVRGYLGACQGAKPLNACATEAAKVAKEAGRPLRFPAGVYPLNGWSPPCPVIIVGDGVGATILQRAVGNGGSVIDSHACGGLTIRNLTIDGDRAHSVTTGNTVILTDDWNFTFDNIEIRNSKGEGNALTIKGTVDDINRTSSELSNLLVHDNDGNGIYFKKHAWNWTLRDSIVRNNGGVGIEAINYVFPPEARQFYNCLISRNNVSYNSLAGISLTSGIAGGTPSKPTNGPFNTVEDCKILNNQADHNGSYGIIMSGGHHIEIGFNIARFNGSGSRSDVAGINSALCRECDVHDNTAEHNDFYGIDAGGGVDTKVHDNTIANNGNAVINNGNGINCGACENVSIFGNFIAGNGWAGGGVQIHVTTYDGGVSGFSMAAKNVSIFRNHLVCSNEREVGVLVLSDPEGTSIEDNWTDHCAPFKGYVLHITSGRIGGNRQDNWTNGVVYTSPDGVYPDAVDTVAVSSRSRDIINTLRPFFYSTNYRTVYSVSVTAPGSGYSTSPKVVFERGGCDTEPTGSVFQDNEGHVVGVNLLTFGTGCTSAPTVAFEDPQGTGAAAVAHVLSLLPINGRRISLLQPGDAIQQSTPTGQVEPTSSSAKLDSFHKNTFQGQDHHWVKIESN